MPSFNRRGFLQILGAASIAPLIPTVPMRAAATGAVPSTSKALWAGLYSNAGSTSKFVGIAKGKGLSNAAIQGVSARSIGVKIALASAPKALSDLAVRRPRLPSPAKPRTLKVPGDIKQTLKRTLLDEPAKNDLREGLDGEDQVSDSLAEHPTPDAPQD